MKTTWLVLALLAAVSACALGDCEFPIRRSRVPSTWQSSSDTSAPDRDTCFYSRSQANEEAVLSSTATSFDFIHSKSKDFADGGFHWFAVQLTEPVLIRSVTVKGREDGAAFVYPRATDIEIWTSDNGSQIFSGDHCNSKNMSRQFSESQRHWSLCGVTKSKLAVIAAGEIFTVNCTAKVWNLLLRKNITAADTSSYLDFMSFADLRLQSPQLSADGATCEINRNDCLVPGTNQSVCVHASSCTDGLGSFTCHCLPGYEGKNCSVDINECELFRQPCQNGAACKDLVADYACTNCSSAFGGKNCSVNMTGCDSNRCQNGATCKPILVQELPTPVHGYQCICNPGWAGRYCNFTSLVSFNGSTGFSALLSSGASSSSGDWIFEFSFRTTLAQFDLIRLSSDWGVIRIGAHNSSLMLLLLNASSSVIGQAKWSVSDSLASADWLTLSVALANGSATLTRIGSGVGQPQTLLVGGLSDRFRRGQISVYVGGERGSAIDSGGFRGCVRDLRLVAGNSTFVATETSVESSNATWGVCSRSMQCGSPSPCRQTSSSMCSDLWNDFVCHCAADFGGRSCSVQLPSFSFGLGGNASSASFSSLPAVSSVFGGDSWTIELRLVTLSPGAFLMLLGDPGNSATTPRLLVTIDPYGRLSVKLLHSNGSQIAALTSSDSVATGSSVSVKISVSISGREMSLTVSSAVKSTSLSSAGPLSQLSGQLIIGGFSGAPAAGIAHSRISKRSVPDLPAGVSSSMPANTTAFRGVVAAPRLNGNKPLFLGPVASSLTDSLPGAVAASDSSGVVTGAVTENICEKVSPCRNGATCTNVFFNSYSCECHPGFRDFNCSTDIPDCHPSPCRSNEVCLEKSDASLYKTKILPKPFSGSFSFASAAGFVCARPFASWALSDESSFAGTAAFAAVLFICGLILAAILAVVVVCLLIRFGHLSRGNPTIDKYASISGASEKTVPPQEQQTGAELKNGNPAAGQEAFELHRTERPVDPGEVTLERPAADDLAVLRVNVPPTQELF